MKIRFINNYFFITQKMGYSVNKSKAYKACVACMDPWPLHFNWQIIQPSSCVRLVCSFETAQKLFPLFQFLNENKIKKNSAIEFGLKLTPACTFCHRHKLCTILFNILNLIRKNMIQIFPPTSYDVINMAARLF